MLGEGDASLGLIYQLLRAQPVIEVGSDLAEALLDALLVVDPAQPELVLACLIEVFVFLIFLFASGSNFEVTILLSVGGILI